MKNNQDMYFYFWILQKLFTVLEEYNSKHKSFIMISELINLNDFEIKNFEIIAENSITNIHTAQKKIMDLREEIFKFERSR